MNESTLKKYKYDLKESYRTLRVVLEGLYKRYPKLMIHILKLSGTEREHRRVMNSHPLYIMMNLSQALKLEFDVTLSSDRDRQIKYIYQYVIEHEHMHDLWML